MLRRMSDKTFSLQELETFDGKDGRPAYTAVDGIVYDITSSRMWRDGLHVRKHVAGKDLSGDILIAPHPKDRLERFPVVGRLEALASTPEPVQEDPIPAMAKLAYRLHAHPASVHFPIALVVVAVLLDFVGVVLGWTGYSGSAQWLCQCAAPTNLILGLLFAPMSIVSGLLDWRYQFDSSLGRLFQAKILLSAAFLVVAGLSAILVTTGSTGLAYHLALWSLAPVVLALGFVGGRITFPAG